MFCLYCGNKLPNDAIFCNRCGKQQKPVESEFLSMPSSPAPLLEIGQAPVGNVPTIQGTQQASTVPTAQATPSTFPHSTAGNEASSVAPRSSLLSRAQSSALPTEPPPVDSPAGSLLSPIKYVHDTDYQHTEQSEAKPESLISNSLDAKQSRPATYSEPKITGHISRRTVIAGLAGAGVLTAGGIAWAIISRIQSNVPLHPTSNANSNGAMFGYDLQRTHFNPSEHILNPGNVSRLVPYWTASRGKGGVSSPTVANGLVFIGSDDYKMYAFDAKTGAASWAYTTRGGVGSSPAVANGVVYVGSGDAKLYALDAGTGRNLWNYTTGIQIDYSSPVVSGGVVYIGSDDANLYAFDARTGEKFWTYSYGQVGGNQPSSPAVVNEVIYVCSGSLYALDKTGTLVWSYTDNTLDGFFFTPTVDDGVVYTCGSVQITISGEPSLGGNLYALDAKTGAKLWKAHVAGRFNGTSPAVANGVVYVASDDHNLYAFDARTGVRQWAASLGAGKYMISSPTVANGVVYIGSDDHNLYAFDATTGATLWTYATGDQVNSSPTVANGVIYIGSDDGKLYAFHLPL